MKHKKVIIFLFVIFGLFICFVFAINMVNKQAHNIITFGNLKVKLLQSEEKNGEEILINNNEQFNINSSSLNRKIEVNGIETVCAGNRGRHSAYHAAGCIHDGTVQ